MTLEPLIITLTGPSASGKSYVLETINKIALDFMNFTPTSFPKYTTREYRAEEILKKKRGQILDVISVDEIPHFCNLVYGTYGKEYGLDTNELRIRLNAKESPIVVVNDVRAVQELRDEFDGKVLSLFIFRSVPSFIEVKTQSAQRGNISDDEMLERYIKATALYRIYIEHIDLFDRVILNVGEYSPGKVDYTQIQVKNILSGIASNQIKLGEKQSKGPKLFIISGNSASGKDDVIQGVKKMGKLQAEIIPKYTSRKLLDDDGDEMICKYIPNLSIIDRYTTEYNRKRELIEIKYNESPPEDFINNCKLTHDRESVMDFENYCEIEWNICRLKELRELAKPLELFWRFNNIEKDFTLNPNYIDLSLLSEFGIDFNPRQNDEICFVIKSDYIDFIYQNHGTKGDGIYYGFSADSTIHNMRNDKKHRVLVASLINILDYCNNCFGRTNVIPVFCYSQISKEDFEQEARTQVDKLAKASSFDDYIAKYSENIVDFRHVLIYAETSMRNKTGGQKEELIDQMFRLFRAYTDK